MILSRAPLRIPLGGGGTDLPSYYEKHGGFILSAGINKFVYIYVNRPSADSLIRVKYSKYEQVERVDQIQHDLVRPALELLHVNGGSLEIASMADVPDGTGMGSSGAYLVALLTALHELKREKIPTQALAESACHIEMNLAGHPVGKHDHYLAAFGGITVMQIEKDGKVHVSPLDVSVDTVEQLKAGTLLYFTGITRPSRDILAEQKSGTESGRRDMVDSLHCTREIGYQIKDALERGDLERYGQLLHAHWENKKKRSSMISVGRIDQWYDRARRSGALGGKVMGAGGGGFLMLYAPPDAKPAVRKAMQEEGLREMPFEFDFDGAKVLVNF
jgi:D-glycero-alpha-D-manno-heptose-7-phosphate kinase